MGRMPTLTGSGIHQCWYRFLTPIRLLSFQEAPIKIDAKGTIRYQLLHLIASCFQCPLDDFCLRVLGNRKERVCSHCSESILMTTFSCSLAVLLLSPGSPTIYLSNLQTNQLYVCSHRPRNYIDEIYN